MPETEIESSRLHPFWQTLADLMAVIRLLRGPIVASIAAAVILFVPDQIREIYRIIAADRSWREIGTGIGALTLMCISFWWVSFRVVQYLGHRQYPGTKPARVLMFVLPGSIGALPLLACGAGLLASRPAGGLPFDITSPWAGKAEEISADVLSGLNTGASVLFALAAVLLAASLLVGWLVARTSGSQLRARDSRRGFFSIYGLLVSLAIVIGVTAAVIAFPVALPTEIGTLPLVAIFFIAIILMVGQLTFWYERTRMPFFMLLGVAALGFSAFDLNDNHEIATVTDPAKAAPPPDPSIGTYLPGTWESFQEWYKARPNRNKFKTTYPVYLVAAQGGGMYAAYHAAILLARLQDRCPEFRNHLFAISSVSGGSLGAAVFASTVKALANPGPAAGNHSQGSRSTGNSSALPCPTMEHTGFYRSISDDPGPHEEAARKILAADFLSPLVAGTLFPDFTQRFLPFPVPTFDRARWLERAFEHAWTEAGLAGSNPFEDSVLRLWSPKGSTPALLINTTESDSGRRLVISPFGIGDIFKARELLGFPLWSGWHPMTRRFCHGHDISLSTAVGLSARFPWLTPAGSLTADCRATSYTEQKFRLVDGGYFDNSGVETALDVIEAIQEGLARNDGRVEGIDGPRIEFNVIVLTTSEFPKRSGYGLGDALEPIRALLSTRQARTPIAIYNAERRLAALLGSREKTVEPQLDHLYEVRFHNPIYQMPLGWRLSKASRDIIDIQGGRFWDCDPDPKYYRQQNTSDFSDADCVQMVVYHQLNETMVDELKVLELADDWRQRRRPEPRPVRRLRHDEFMACYNDALRQASQAARPRSRWVSSDGNAQGEPPVRQGLQRRQRDAIEQILRLWERSPQLTDDRWLAYMLAYVDYVSGAVSFRDGGCLTEKCTLSYLQGMSQSTGDSSYATMLKPEPNGNRYYGRGFFQISFPYNYQRVTEITGEPIYDHPDLLLAPDVSARVLFASMTDPRLFPNLTLDKFTTAIGFNLEQALGKHGGLRGLAQVQLSNDRFMACIAVAKAAN